jgi:hypothetical protein
MKTIKQLVLALTISIWVVGCSDNRNNNNNNNNNRSDHENVLPGTAGNSGNKNVSTARKSISTQPGGTTPPNAGINKGAEDDSTNNVNSDRKNISTRKDNTRTNTRKPDDANLKYNKKDTKVDSTRNKNRPY